jgi:hypothetical protein
VKTTITLLFIALYGIALIRPVFPLVEYYLKMEVYLERCANKKRPELHCNGQCILMQKMKAMNTESQDQSRPAPVKINFEDYPIGFVEELPGVESPACSTSKPLNVSRQIVLSSAHKTAVFHPPS